MQVRLRAKAVADVEAAVTYYLDVAGQQTALDFVDSFEAAVGHLRQFPLSGSLRLGYELDIPGLRSWHVGNFPYVAFYTPGDEVIDVWRVLHSRRDLPAAVLADTSG